MDITCEEVGLSKVLLGQVGDAHAQKIFHNDIITIPLHEFKQPSRRYY
jgi:hypothetical protein